MTKLRKKFGRAQALSIVVPAWVLTYPIIGFLSEFREVNYLSLWVDNYVPLWTPAILVYVLYYPLCLVPFLVIKDEEILRKGVRAFVYGIMMTALVFIVYPVAMIRPVESLEVDGVLDKIVWLLWKFDTPANAFPSQHVALIFICVFILAAGVKERSRRWVWMYAMISVLISVSTMVVKQHYVWDVLSGVVVAGIAYYLAFVRPGTKSC